MTLTTEHEPGTQAQGLPTPGTYTVDKAHTVVGFVGRHLIGTKVRGRFTDFDADLTIAEDPTQSTLVARAKAASITTGVTQRDDHLRTNDFLDAPNHPEVVLQSTGLSRVSDDEWKLATDLTIRGVTKPVVFDLTYEGHGPGMAPGTEVVAFSASAEIDRREFGVSFNGLVDGNIVVGNKVRIEIEVEAGLAT
jgi:polyisoprenoid-binding protein YceI